MEKFLTALFLTESVQHIIRPKIVKNILPNGSILIQAGLVNNDLFFLEKGIARGYYCNDNDNDNEITSWIVAEGSFVAVPHSFFGRKPSVETVHLLEKSVVYSISYDDLNEIIQNQPEVATLKSRLVEQYLIHYDDRLRALRSTSAFHRLSFFEEHNKELLNRVPLKYIASFIGITPQTLSKLRTERMRKEKLHNQ